MGRYIRLWIAFPLLWGAVAAQAGSILVIGIISQSTPDGTGPAVNNPALNSIVDLESYTLTLAFPVAISAPGDYLLTGSALTFADPSAPASESAFGDIHLSVVANGSVDQFSLLACLTSGSGCAFGNQLSASFSIPAALLTAENVSATGLDQPHPLDLLEDDGTTDIHGSITGYSSTPESASAPEPSYSVMAAFGLAGLLVAHRTSNKKRTL